MTAKNDRIPHPHKELIIPMVFFDKNNPERELITPMDFFDPAPLPERQDDPTAQPEVQPMIMCQTSQESHTSALINQTHASLSNEIHGITALRPEKFDSDFENAYDIAHALLLRVPIRIIRENFYVFSGISYTLKTRKDICRLIIASCRAQIKNKSSHFIENIADFLLKEPDIFVREKELPRHLVAFQNGVLDLKNGFLYNHSPQHLLLHEINAHYTTAPAPCPIFDQFLRVISGGDTVLIDRIWQMLGYILTPDTQGKCFFLLQGVANSGKSVLSNIIQSLFSEDAVMPLDVRFFNDKFAVSSLVGKALCSSPDLPSAPLDERTVSKLKQLTGNDPTSSDVKFGQQVKFLCGAKLIFATNHALLTKTPDDAFYYRCCTIPFRFSIPRDQQDHALEDKIFHERDAIVSRAIASYFVLRANNYRFPGDYPPNSCISHTLPIDVDVASQIFSFLQQNLVEDTEGFVFTEDLYEKYIETHGSIPINPFSNQCAKLLPTMFRTKKDRRRKPCCSNPQHGFTGISFREEAQQ